MPISLILQVAEDCPDDYSNMGGQRVCVSAWI